MTELFKPIILSLPDGNAWKRLNIMINKAENEEEFSDIEGLELINLPRFCLKNQDKAIELICRELPKLKLNLPALYRAGIRKPNNIWYIILEIFTAP